MWWMSIVGPILVALIWLTTSWRDRNRESEIERWRGMMGARRSSEKVPTGYRSVSVKTVEKVSPGPKLASALPGPLQRVIDAAGGGDALGHYELVPKLAYLSAMSANAMTGSDLQAVTGKLEENAPAFIVRPLPIIEGERIANTGIEFKKDPDFTGLFQVDAVMSANPPPRPGSKDAKTPQAPLSDADAAKKIRSWLSRPVREALRDLPEAWLYVQGRAMALVIYGPADASKLNELVTAADVIFAEYGDEGGPSLFDEDDEDDEVEAAPAPTSPKPAPKKSKPAAKGASAKT